MSYLKIQIQQKLFNNILVHVLYILFILIYYSSLWSIKSRYLFKWFFINKKYDKKYGTLHDFACYPCAGAMLIFSVLFQF